MPVQKANIQLEQGVDFSAEIQLQSNLGIMYDLTNVTLTAEMRKSWQSVNFHSFNCSIVDPINGVFSISMDWSNTSLIDAGRYLYDIVLTDLNSNTKVRVIEGIVYVSPGITRS